MLAFHLSSERLFTSPSTAKNGEYAMRELPYGYFELAVETPQGLIVGNQVVNVPPSGKVAILLSIPADSGVAAGAAPKFPGTEQPVIGSAQVSERLRGRDFWTSRTGVSILAGVGALVLLGLVATDDDDTPATIN